MRTLRKWLRACPYRITNTQMPSSRDYTPRDIQTIMSKAGTMLIPTLLKTVHIMIVRNKSLWRNAHFSQGYSQVYSIMQSMLNR
jgi:hypothetical protein